MMRQRKNVFAVSTKEEREADDEAESSDPDEEENIQAVHPPDVDDVEEEEQSRKLLPWKNYQQTNELVRQFIDDFVDGKVWWVQCLTIIITSILTYSYNNVNSHHSHEDEFIRGTNVQIAIMTIITLVGASPFCKTHLLTAGIGAFVGGQNIIGATGLESFGATSISVVSYLWLIVLGFVVGLIWCFVMNNSKFNKILDGYSGRLGTTTFIGMNITMIVLWGPLGVVDFNRYYFGFVHIIHIGEEDSAYPPAPMSSAWKWSEEIELAIGYILAVIWLGTIAGATRIVHNRHVQQWHHHHNNNNIDDTSSSQQSQLNPSTQPPVPLNNILIPVIWALLSMLIVNATQYKYAPGLYNGFAVGSYVAMASLQKIPTITKFATVSLVAAGWGLTLTPIFVGFAGKSGFTSMMGHVTHIAIENMIERIRISKRRQQQQQQQQQELREEQSQHSSEQGIEHQTQQQQQQQIEQPLQPQPPSKEEDQPQPQPPPPPPTPPHLQPKKHLKPREPYLTKQQRRQQQRLQAQQQQQQQQPSRLQQQQQQDQQQQIEEQSTPLLHHRAWSAAPQKASGDGIWEHPMHNKTDDLPTNDATTTTVTSSEPSTNLRSIQDASSNKLGVV